MKVYFTCKECGDEIFFARTYPARENVNDYNGAYIHCDNCGNSYEVRVSLYKKNDKEKE